MSHICRNRTECTERRSAYSDRIILIAVAAAEIFKHKEFHSSIIL